jgi:hypothetical protein
VTGALIVGTAVMTVGDEYVSIPPHTGAGAHTGAGTHGRQAGALRRPKQLQPAEPAANTATAARTIKLFMAGLSIDAFFGREFGGKLWGAKQLYSTPFDVQAPRVGFSHHVEFWHHACRKDATFYVTRARYRARLSRSHS